MDLDTLVIRAYGDHRILYNEDVIGRSYPITIDSLGIKYRLEVGEVSSSVVVESDDVVVGFTSITCERLDSSRITRYEYGRIICSNTKIKRETVQRTGAISAIITAELPVVQTSE